jgi:hypothetical protein
MSTLISLFLILHFVIAGLVLEKVPRFFTTRMVAGVFAYFFAVHLAFGYVLRAAPWLVDPR